MTNEIIDILNGLEREKFYGSLEIRYEHGRITIVKKTQTLKLQTDDRNNRGANYAAGRV